MSELDRQLGLCEPEGEAWRETVGARKSCFQAGRGLGEPASLIGGCAPPPPTPRSGNLRCAVAVCCRCIAQGLEVSQRTSGGATGNQPLWPNAFWLVPAEWERSLPAHTGLVSVNSARFSASWDLKYWPSALHWPFCQVSHRKSNQHNRTSSEVLFLIFMQMFAQISVMTDKITAQIMDWEKKATEHFFSQRNNRKNNFFFKELLERDKLSSRG